MKKSVLRKYATLIATVGVNVQKGQEVFIAAELDQPEFVKMVVEECYRAGAKRVVVDWDYQPLTKLHVRWRSQKNLSTLENWEEARWQQLLLPRQRENGRPVHLFGGQISTGDGSFGDMQELCFGGGQGHVRVPNPFSGFFDGVGDEQRGGTDERAQGVADHVVRLRKPQRAAVLGVLNSRAEDAADERCEDDSAPTVPLLRQGIRERQPQREEEKDVHQHLAVKLGLPMRGDECGKWCEDNVVVSRRAGQDGGIEDDEGGCKR